MAPHYLGFTVSTTQPLAKKKATVHTALYRRLFFVLILIPKVFYIMYMTAHKIRRRSMLPHRL
jgi:hypothetical protein